MDRIDDNKMENVQGGRTNLTANKIICPKCNEIYAIKTKVENGKRYCLACGSEVKEITVDRVFH